MQSTPTDGTDRGQRLPLLPQWLIPQRLNLAIVVMTFIQLGSVYNNPINSRANTTLSESPGNSNNQNGHLQPYNISTASRNLKARARAPDAPGAPFSPLIKQVVQPLSPSFSQGNQLRAPASNQRINTLSQSTSQNREAIDGGRYVVSRPGPNATDKFQAAEVPPMYSPADLVVEGSGNGPLKHNSKRKPSSKLDDTEDGDDEDEEDYDDREIVENSPDPEIDPFSRQPLNNNRPPIMSSTNWPDAGNDPYAPFRGPGHTNTNNRPNYPQTIMATQANSHQRPPRPHQNQSHLENADLDRDGNFTRNPPNHPFPAPPAPSGKLDALLNAHRDTPELDKPIESLSVPEYPSRTNRSDARPAYPSIHVNNSDQILNLSDKSKFVPNNLNLTQPHTQPESNKTTLADAKSKDQDVDYDYEEEMDEEEAEDTSAFEDGEPLDFGTPDNKTVSSYPKFDNENLPSHNNSHSNAKNFPNKINNLPATTITNTNSPASNPGVTMTTPRQDVTTTSKPDLSTTEGQDYSVEEDDEDPEDEREDSDLVDDDLDKEDDMEPGTESVEHPATNPPPIQVITSKPSTATLIPELVNSNKRGPDNDLFGLNRALNTPPYDGVETVMTTTREPDVFREVPSTEAPPFAITTTIPPPYHPPSTTQPATTTTTTTTVTSLLTLKPTSSPPTTRTPLLTNWYTTPKSVDAIPSLGTNPGVSNYGSGSLEDDTGLTRQIYDKAVEVYQTVHKAVVSAVDAVSQPNIDWSSSTFEPLLSQPLFFMRKYMISDPNSRE